jgi:hypothetical protein
VGLHYEHIAIINDASRVVSKLRSKLWHLSHDSRGVIYDQNVFKIYVPRVVNYAPKNIYIADVTNDDCHLQLSYFYSTGH